MSYTKEHVARGRKLVKAKDRLEKKAADQNWEIGDLAIEALGPPEGSHGPGVTREVAATRGQFAREIGVKVKSLIDYRKVSYAFPAERRRIDPLSWATHREIQRRAGNDEEAHALIAERDDWTVRKVTKHYGGSKIDYSKSEVEDEVEVAKRVWSHPEPAEVVA